MSTAPLPAIIHHPWFIADVPGWHNEGVEDGDFIEDRIFLEDCIRKREIALNITLTVSTLLKASGKRLFFQSAFHFRDIHQRFVETHCLLTEENKRAAREQLDIVLGLYPELGNGEGVRNVEDLLGEQEVMSRRDP
jgi:hypothetical protein